MATYKNPTPKSKPNHRSRSLLLSISTVSVVVLFILFSYSIPTPQISNPIGGPTYKSIETKEKTNAEILKWKEKKYLYWGDRIDCPGKHCDSCEGLGHQESSLRCALEEALFLKRVFVMPSGMCINPIHNKKGILHHLINASSEERWAASSCSLKSLYDMDLISETIPVILDNSKTWYRVLSTSMKLGKMGMAQVEGISRVDLRDNSLYSNALLINRTASPLSWFMECKDRNNRSSIMLPYSFLPLMVAKKLRDAADKIKGHLGDYDAIHVRRGDKIKTRKDRHGVDRTLHPHLDRDTRPEFIQLRIAKWIPPGRTLFIASNERSLDFFSPLSARQYKSVVHKEAPRLKNESKRRSNGGPRSDKAKSFQGPDAPSSAPVPKEGHRCPIISSGAQGGTPVPPPQVPSLFPEMRIKFCNLHAEGTMSKVGHRCP